MNVIKTIAKASLAFAALIVPATVNAAWGEWEEYCTATFDAHYWYRKPMTDLKVERRVDTTNADRVQYKVNGMFGETPGCPPVDLIINANFAVNAPTAGDVAIWIDDQLIESYDVYGQKTDIYLCDAATYYETFFPNDPDYLLAYEDASYFRKETGTFHIYSYYHYADGKVPFLDAFFNETAQGPETLRLHSPEFKNYTPEFGSATFNEVDGQYYYNIPVVINDLSQIKMTVVKGEPTDIRSICQEMINGSVDCVTVTEDGLASIPFDGTGGKHTLVYLTYRADGTTYQMGSQSFDFDPDWKSIGQADFTDGIISKFLEGDMKNNLGLDLPEEAFTYKVEAEESVNAPGVYRLVNPYGSTSPYWNVSFSVVSLKHNENNYMVINATDPDKVYVEEFATGFYYGTTPVMAMSMAFDWLNEDYEVAQIPTELWGKKDGDTISFEAGDEELGIFGVKILSSQSEVYGRAVKIKLPSTGVDLISADENDGLVEYYNLQGIRVMKPAAGNVYIRRQGNTVTKEIMR